MHGWIDRWKKGHLPSEVFLSPLGRDFFIYASYRQMQTSTQALVSPQL